MAVKVNCSLPSSSLKNVWHFALMEEPTVITTVTDTDWVADPITRRCTTGGVMRLASCCLLTWSRTLHGVLLPSAEAEYNGIAVAAQESLWVKTLAGELGVPLRVVI